jgi:hypothetical protein
LAAWIGRFRVNTRHRANLLRGKNRWYVKLRHDSM